MRNVFSLKAFLEPPDAQDDRLSNSVSLLLHIVKDKRGYQHQYIAEDESYSDFEIKRLAHRELLEGYDTHQLWPAYAIEDMEELLSGGVESGPFEEAFYEFAKGMSFEEWKETIEIFHNATVFNFANGQPLEELAQ